MFIKNLVDHIKIHRIIRGIIKEENLLNNLSVLFSTKNYTVTFKKDWIGRIYAVINPIVQSPENRIFEYDTQGMNLKSFINKWVIEHMIAADNFIKNHQLFDILIYDIKPIDEDYNFLITLTPVTWFDLQKSLKVFLYSIGGILILAIVAAIIIAIVM